MARVDLNIFDMAGTILVDLASTVRKQIPSFADDRLVGFSGGFPCE